MAKSIRIPLAGLALTTLALAAAAQSPSAQAAQTRDYHIESQPLPAAVNEWADQAGLQVMWSAQMRGAQREAPEVAGRFSAPVALERVLQGSGLTFAFLDERTVAIRLASAARQPSPPQGSGESAVRSSSPSQGEETGEDQKRGEGRDENSTQSVRGDDSATASKAETISEVVVTGTHIRGGTESASPIQVFTRYDFDRMGISTVQGLVEKLPQNFSSASENTIATVAGNISASNGTNATGIDLRGMGNDSTLVLVNGRRIASGGLNGNITDVSLIPLSAVERVEVLTDGASAIYGADAVGGVVNFILREDYDGAETSVRYGSVSDGPSRELQLSQIFGTKWRDGSAVFSYEYSDRTPLSASEREISRSAELPFSLVPEQTRHGAFLSIRQSVGDGIDLFADGTFADRSTEYETTFFGDVQRNPADISSYSSALGGRFALPNGAAVEISASYARSTTRTDTFSGLAAETIARYKIESDVFSLDAKLDGIIGRTHAGSVSYAIGGQFRKESLATTNTTFDPISTVSFEPNRDVAAGFVELRVPLLADTTGNEGAARLQLSLADRYEHYDDFGSTNNPQLGLIWRPLSSIRIRGTAGTSFKAPLLIDTNPTPAQATAFPLDDPTGDDACFFTTTNTCTNVLIVSGGNPSLDAEKATTWTVGLDFQPANVSGLRIGVTYFDIDFEDRVSAPGSLVSVLEALNQEPLLGASIVQRNPSQAVVQQFAASATEFSNFVGDLATVGALVDYRVRNLSTVQSSGLDLSASYSADTSAGTFGMGVDGTYILKYENKFTDATPATDLLNTPYNPIDLRLRAHTDYQLGPFSAAVFINYSDSYSDDRSEPSVPVASWTTIDVNLSYEFGFDQEYLSGAKVIIGARNIADKAPPRVSNPYGINFDGNNANALGRFIYAQLSKAW